MTEATSSQESGTGECLVHEALLYHSTDGYAEQLSQFVAAAQAADEPVLAVLPAERLATAQRACGDHAENVRWETMDEVGHNPSCLLAVYSDWVVSHQGRVRILGEPVWPGRGRAESIECLRHEALVNHELSTSPVTLLCPYDADRLDTEIIAGAEMTHPRLVGEDGRRRDSPRYDEPLDVATGKHWPLAPPVEPISEHAFAGDLGSLRRSVASDRHAADLGRRVVDLVFAVSEAASNALKHADGTCITRLWRDGGSIVSEVSTRSAMDDPYAGRRRPPWDAEDGRGLWMINHVCDLVELRSRGGETVLRMHVRCAT